MMNDWYDLSTNQELWNTIKPEIYQKAGRLFATGLPYDDGCNTGWFNIASNMKYAGFTYDEVASISSDGIEESQWDGWQSDDVGVARGFLAKTLNVKLPPPQSNYQPAPKNNNDFTSNHDAFKRKEWNWKKFENTDEGFENASNDALKLLQKLYGKTGSVYYSSGTGDTLGKYHPEKVKRREKPSSDWLQGMFTGDSGKYLAINGAVAGETLRDGVVTSFRYGFVEFDPEKDSNISKTEFIEDLKKQLEGLTLPWIGAVYSGNKSIHVYLKVGAKDKNEWQKRMDAIYEYIKEEGIESLDESGKQITRWCRFPVGHRMQGYQYVMAINEKPMDFLEWKKAIKKQDNSVAPVVPSAGINLLDPTGKKIDSASMIEYIASKGFATFISDKDAEIIKIDGKQVEECNCGKIKALVYKEVANDFPMLQSMVINHLGGKYEGYFVALPMAEITTHTDTKNQVYMYFQNEFIEVTKDEVIHHDYNEMDGYVWKGQINSMNRTFNPLTEKGVYERFVENITSNGGVVNETNKRGAMSIIGYLMSRYKNIATSKAIFITEKAAGSDEGADATGGTGKGIFLQALKQFRIQGEIDGKTYNNDDKFKFSNYQYGQSQMVIQDVTERFDVKNIYNLITNDFPLEKKGLDKESIPFDKSPKIIITSNYVLKGMNEGSTDRRLIVLEIENYYSAKFSPYDEFGCAFFTDDWDVNEWSRFDYFIVQCVQEYLKNGVHSVVTEQFHEKKIMASIKGKVDLWFDEWEVGYNIGYGMNKEFHKLEIGKFYPHEEILKLYRGWMNHNHYDKAMLGDIKKLNENLKLYLGENRFLDKRSNGKKGKTFFGPDPDEADFPDESCDNHEEMPF